MPKPSKSTSAPSFFALISDIHSNLDALEAVLRDISDFPVRGIFCLGDIVGYGPEPGECVKRVMDLCSVSVLGNHEAMLLLADKILEEDWDVPIRKPLQIAKEQVSRSELGWLRDLPITADLDPITLSAAFADGYVIGPDGITTFYGNCRQGSAIGPNGVTVWNNGPNGGTIIGPEGTTVWSGTRNQIIVTGSGGTSLWSSPSGIKITPCGICE